MTLAFWQRFFAGGTSRLYLKSASCGVFLVCRPGAIVLGGGSGAHSLRLEAESPARGEVRPDIKAGPRGVPADGVVPS